MQHLHDTQDDATLVARVLAGERELFTPLLLRHASGVTRLCNTLLGETQEAQDIAQEAAIQAFLGLEHLREPARFGAWFHAIAANLARSALRHRQHASLHLLAEDATTELLWSCSLPSLETIHEMRETHNQIISAINALSDINRPAVIGFYLQGYSYQELAHVLGVSVGTVKGRIFQGRRQLKAALRPLADTILQPDNKRRKEHGMPSPQLIELHIDSLHTLLLTRQHFVILRDEQSNLSLPIQLTATEAEDLLLALNNQHAPASLPTHQHTLPRLLETLGAQVRQVVVNQLMEQTFYATLTLAQGEHIHEMDMRLSDALALAVRMHVPLYATAALLQEIAQLDTTASPDLSTRHAGAPKTGYSERIHQENTTGQALTSYQWHGAEKFSDRLWAFLLEDIAGTRDSASLADLSSVDISAHFSEQKLIWQEQPVVALHLHDEQEMAWLLVQPAYWNRITRALQHLQTPAPHDASSIASTQHIPDVLLPSILQQIETCLAALLKEPELTSAFLLNAHGTLVAHKGVDTQEIVLNFSRQISSSLTKHLSQIDQNERIKRLLGNQPQKAALLTVDKQAFAQAFSTTTGGVMMLDIHQHWHLIVTATQKPTQGLREAVYRHLTQAKHDLEQLLTQAT